MSQQPVASPDDLLSDVASVREYVVRRHIVAADERDVDVSRLGGGVSNGVFAVTVAGRGLVLKQSLPKLNVADEWYAQRERILTEADGLRIARGISPDSVPEVADSDAAAFTLVMTRAPVEWRDWKGLLLSGQAQAWVAARLGVVLAAWHVATLGGASLGIRLHDLTAFEQLRADPYYRTVMRRRPDVAPAVSSHLDAMASRRCCLVHGDFSPKNVLVGDHDLWVIDFEVAHYGDPAFDLAFLLSHLLLKSVHRPIDAGSYRRCAEAFASAYSDRVPTSLDPDWPYVLGHIGCLLLARVDGKSPAEYLTTTGQDQARELGRRLLSEPPSTIAQAYQWLAGLR